MGKGMEHDEGRRRILVREAIARELQEEDKAKDILGTWKVRAAAAKQNGGNAGVPCRHYYLLAAMARCATAWKERTGDLPGELFQAESEMDAYEIITAFLDGAGLLDNRSDNKLTDVRNLLAPVLEMTVKTKSGDFAVCLPETNKRLNKLFWREPTRAGEIRCKMISGEIAVAYITRFPGDRKVPAILDLETMELMPEESRTREEERVAREWVKTVMKRERRFWKPFGFDVGEFSCGSVIES